MPLRLLRSLSRARRRGTLTPPAEWLRLQNREAEMLRWTVKVLGSDLVQRHYDTGLAGPQVPLPEAPKPAGLTSRTCRQADIEGRWVRHWCRALGTTPFYHRKLWEDCFILQALWEAGMLAPGRRALGFAVGQEPLPGDPRLPRRRGAGDRHRRRGCAREGLDRHRPARRRDRSAVPPAPLG